MQRVPLEIIELIFEDLYQSEGQYGPIPLMSTCRTFHWIWKPRSLVSVMLTRARQIAAFHNLLKVLLADGAFADSLQPTRHLLMQTDWHLPRLFQQESTQEELDTLTEALEIIALLAPHLQTLTLHRIGVNSRPWGASPLATLSFPNLRKLIALEQNALYLYGPHPILHNLTHLYIPRWTLNEVHQDTAPHLQYLRIEQMDQLRDCDPILYWDFAELESVIADVPTWVRGWTGGRFQFYKQKLEFYKQWMDGKGELMVGDAWAWFKGGQSALPVAWRYLIHGDGFWTKDWKPAEAAKLAFESIT